MKVKEKKVKGIIVKSNLPGVDYVINPYTGCQHGCIYCYAEFMKRFSNHAGEKWGSFVDVKINGPELVKGNLKGKHVMFGSVTDPYQPVEARYEMTRKILEKLVGGHASVEVLTKSKLVARDIDLFKKFDDITIGISLAILDDKLSRILEPVASSPEDRLEALKKCHEAGIKTWLFVSPIFPYITDVEPIIKASKDFVDWYGFENLNLRPHNRGRIFDFLKKHKPELVDKYREIYSGKLDYWDKLEDEIKRICAKYGKEGRIYFHHGGFS